MGKWTFSLGLSRFYFLNIGKYLTLLFSDFCFQTFNQYHLWNGEVNQLMWNGEVNQLTQTQKKNEQNKPGRLILYAGGEDYLFITLQIHLHKPLSHGNFFCFLFIYLTCADTWYSSSTCDLPSNFFQPCLWRWIHVVDWELWLFKLCRLFPFAGFHYRRRQTTKNTRLFQERNKQGFHVATKIYTWNQFSLKYSGRQGNPSYRHDNRFRSLMVLTETKAVLR